MEGGWTPHLTLESNEYQSYILKFASNGVQKLCDLLGGRGGGHQKITLDHRGEGGRSKWAKKGSHNIWTLPYGPYPSTLDYLNLIFLAIMETRPSFAGVWTAWQMGMNSLFTHSHTLRITFRYAAFFVVCLDLGGFAKQTSQSNGFKEDKLGLSCAKLRASLNLSGFE